MNEIERIVKLKQVNNILQISISEEIQRHMNVNKGDRLKLILKNNKILEIEKFNPKSINVWFCIGDKYWWSRQIQEGFWDLANPKSPDRELFESIKPNDIVLAYYKSPIRAIHQILITKEGYNLKDRGIYFKIKHTLKNPITYDDFKILDILSEYRNMSRRSIVPVDSKDWGILKNKIIENDNRNKKTTKLSLQ